MKKYLILPLFWIICSQMLWGQEYVDSLKQVLQNAESEKDRSKTCYYLALHYVYNESLKTIEYAKKGLEHVVNCDDCKRIEYFLLNLLAWSEAEVNNWDNAREAANRILRDEPLYGVEEAKAEGYRILGYIYFRELDYDKSLEYYKQSLEEGKRTGNPSDIGGAYSNMGMIFHVQDDFETARKYYYLALEALQNGGDPHFLANTYTKIADISDDLEERERLVDSAIVIHENLKNFEYLASTYVDKGNIYYDQEMYSKALEIYKKGLPYLNGPTLERDYIYAKMGKTFLDLDQIDSTIYYATIALENIIEGGGSIYVQRELNHTLALAHLEKGNKGETKKYYELGIAVADSIYSEENKEQKSKFDAKFEHERQSAEIAQQQLQISEQQATQNQILLFGAVLLALLIGMFQYFFYKQKRKKRETEIALENQQLEAERLRELDRLKSSFFTNISHELRTPLTLVAAPLDDALEEVKPGPLRNHLQLAQSNTKKLLRLVNEILDLSKLEAGKLEAKKSEKLLVPLIRRMFYAFESVAHFRGLQLVFNTNISPKLLVNLDEEKFEKILNNLLSNAIKYTESGGTITLNANQKEDGFHFQVIDNGAGISSGELEKVFDRFYQSTEKGKALKGGTGIGLALAKELAVLLNGDLTVESTVGKGSTFTAILPLEKVTEEKADKERSEQIVVDQAIENLEYLPILLNGEKPKILIVEDNPEMSDYLRKSLSNDYRCTIATNGREALEKLEQGSFDLITSDIMMPQMDGFELRTSINEREEWRRIPFIMLTARSMEQDKLEGLRMGVDDYLIKPFSLRELKARIHNLISNKVQRGTFSQEDPEAKKELNVDERLLRDAEAYVIKRIDDTQLRVDDLAKELGFSPRHLSRTLGKLTGMTPVNFILELRLQKARQLLEDRKFRSVSEVRYEIGIESASYFTKKFTERFGKNPKSYLHD